MFTTKRRDQHHPVPIGARVLTLDGAIPVEHLFPGDYVITRTGAHALRSVSARDAEFRLRFDRPETIYADGREVPC